MIPENARSWLDSAHRVLLRLARPGGEQLDYVRDLGGSIDELGLEFDDVVAVLLPWLQGNGHDDACTLVRKLDAALSSEDLSWDESAILAQPAWDHVRTLARAAADEIGRLSRGR